MHLWDQLLRLCQLQNEQRLEVTLLDNCTLEVFSQMPQHGCRVASEGLQLRRPIHDEVERELAHTCGHTQKPHALKNGFPPN